MVAGGRGVKRLRPEFLREATVIRTEQSVDVARAPGDVFAFLDDASRTSSWMGLCTKLEQTSPAPKGVGTTMHYAHNQGAGGGTMDGVVTQYEAGRRLEMTFIDKMFEIVVSFVVEPSGTGATVTYVTVVTPVGLLAKMMTPMIRTAMPQQMAKDVAKLKELLAP
jgi:carbon monoxide dehydrogenase subunit G